MPHESPPSMWVPLAVLAVLAVVGGLIGISPAFTGGAHVGGRANIVNWLQPVIWNPQERVQEKGRGVVDASAQEGHEAAAGEEAVAPYGDTGFNLAHAAAQKLGSERAAEWLFIIISLVVAGIGMGLGWLFYIKDTRLPDVWAQRLAPLYRASYNKYWIDELYAMLFTRRTMDAARGVYAFDSEGVDGAVNGSAWLTRKASLITGAFDRLVVDGLVNGIAGFIKRLMSPLLRAAQTGFAQNYALVMVIGLAVAVALFFGGDFLKAFWPR
ncbi:MAG: hypothetical protein WBP93_15450, partial [Pyrinomonadaceae bacterium]